MFVVSAALGLLPAASALCSDHAVSASQRPRVIVTTSLIADAVSALAGDRVALTTLMGAGVDPHSYKPTYGDLRSLNQGDLILFHGLHLEGKMSKVLASLSRNRRSVAVSSVFSPSELIAVSANGGEFDPHVWFDVRLWERVVAGIAVTLAHTFPTLEPELSQRAAAYRAELAELDRWVRAQIALIPAEQRVLITAHDAFGYFGRAYGIEVRALQGISTLSEFGLNDLSRLAQFIVQRKIKAVFVESSVPDRFVRALREGVQARGQPILDGGSLFSDALDRPGSVAATYAGMVRYNVAEIVAALR